MTIDFEKKYLLKHFEIIKTLPVSILLNVKYLELSSISLFWPKSESETRIVTSDKSRASFSLAYTSQQS